MLTDVTESVVESVFESIYEYVFESIYESVFATVYWSAFSSHSEWMVQTALNAFDDVLDSDDRGIAARFIQKHRRNNQRSTVLILFNWFDKWFVKQWGPVSRMHRNLTNRATAHKQWNLSKKINLNWVNGWNQNYCYASSLDQCWRSAGQARRKINSCCLIPSDDVNLGGNADPVTWAR